MTSKPLHRLMADLENELPFYCQGAAINYIDAKYDGVWTRALAECERDKNLGALYFEQCIKWAKEYKAAWLESKLAKGDTSSVPPWDEPWVHSSR